MHSRVAYDEEEAEHIFGNVKMFMRKLVALGLIDSAHENLHDSTQAVGR